MKVQLVIRDTLLMCWLPSEKCLERRGSLCEREREREEYQVNIMRLRIHPSCLSKAEWNQLCWLPSEKCLERRASLCERERDQVNSAY